MVAQRNPCGLVGSLFEGFSLSFLTQLDRGSYDRTLKMILAALTGSGPSKGIVKPDTRQRVDDPRLYVEIEGYYIKSGSREPSTPDNVSFPF